jgi:hypothetical protein
MDPINPYESPAETTQGGARNNPDDDFWHEGELLVMRRKARWPDRCVRCNHSATSRVSFEGRKSSGWMDLLWIFPQMIGIGNMDAETQDVAVLRLGVCDAHKSLAKGGRLVTVKKMNARFVWLAGVSAEFRAETPAWTPRR